MTPLKKALEEAKRRKQTLDIEIESNIGPINNYKKMDVIILEDVEEILQQMEIDMINECDEKEAKLDKPHNQSDHPKQSY